MTQTIRADGPFRLHKVGAARPKREHPTFEAAEAEAKRIQASEPGQDFVIAQEIARVVANG